MFGYDVFGSPVKTFHSEDVPTILVKIKNGMVEHQLSNWSGDTWTPYGSWSSYLNTAYVKNRLDGATVGTYTYSKHCVIIHESDDPNVPVGTKYGSACPSDATGKNCPENSTLVNGLCECDDGFELKNGICKASGGGIITTMTQSCSDANRETNSAGGCASSCKSGYEFDSSDLCVPIEDEDEDGLPWGKIALVGGIATLILLSR